MFSEVVINLSIINILHLLGYCVLNSAASTIAWIVGVTLSIHQCLMLDCTNSDITMVTRVPHLVKSHFSKSPEEHVTTLFKEQFCHSLGKFLTFVECAVYTAKMMKKKKKKAVFAPVLPISSHCLYLC